MRNVSRRETLRRLGSLGTLGGLRVAAPFGLQLAGIGAAAAATQPQDYRAIVCLFLLGGNDCHNTVIPLEPSAFAAYEKSRGSIALPRKDLLPLAGTQLGLHPSMAPMQGLFDTGRAGLLANVGTLVVPIKDAYAFRNTTIARPPKLFSHNDQTTIWQAFSPEGAKTGWGGKMADLLASQNKQHLFTAVSAAGNAVFLASDKTVQYQITNSGAVGFNRGQSGSVFGSGKGAEALRAQVMAGRGDLFQSEYGTVVERSIEAHGLVTEALNTLPERDVRVALPDDLKDDRLAQQLRIVARMIGVRDHRTMQQKRQVFFVALNGFDTHDNQLEKQAELLASVAKSVAYFQQSMERLGTQENVTLFTGSDFGRTLISNGDGSDHGWGGHHFMVGGAVRGGKVYGQYPDTALKSSLDVGNGRLLPTTAVDQYAATLATWMGVRDSDLGMVLPNIGHFDQRNLGFMA